MTSQNLPAVRTTATVAVPAATQTQPAVRYPQAGNLFLLAYVAGIVAGSATWAHLWTPAIGVGATSVALATAGIRQRRHERNR